MQKLATFGMILIAFLSAPLFPGVNPPSVFADSSGITVEDLFVKGHKSIQAGTGIIASPLFILKHRRGLDYWMTFVRAGYFLTDPSEKRFFLRGNLEALMQVSGSAVTAGFGNHMLEFAMLIRYNVVYPRWWIAPYFQIGVGALYNDLYKDRSQDLIGQMVEFSPQASLGFRYILTKGWSLDAEGIFHHISNAGLSENGRNVGSNSFGVLAGVTHYF